MSSIIIFAGARKQGRKRLSKMVLQQLEKDGWSQCPVKSENGVKMELRLNGEPATKTQFDSAFFEVLKSLTVGAIQL